MDDLAPSRALMGAEKLARTLAALQAMRPIRDHLPGLHDHHLEMVRGAFRDLMGTMAPVLAHDRPEPPDPSVAPLVSDVTDELRSIVSRSSGKVS